MAAERQRYEGFLPGQHVIDGYGAGGFTFAGMSHRGSILALPKGIVAWSVRRLEELTIDSLADLLAEPADAVELVIFGTGDSLRLLPRDIQKGLRAKGVRFDPMATGHAIATYNILLEERRKVAAALIAAG